MIIIWLIEWKQPTNPDPIKTHKRIWHISQHTQQKTIVWFVVYYLHCWTKTSYKDAIIQTHKRIWHKSQNTQQKSIVRFVIYNLTCWIKNTFFQSSKKTNTQVNLKHITKYASIQHLRYNSNINAFDHVPLLNLRHYINIKKNKKINQALNLIYNF